MNFEQKYEKIKNSVDVEMQLIENSIKNLFKNEAQLDNLLYNFLSAPSKRLRPLIGILFLKSTFKKLNENQRKIILATELIHNATLIHDDIIDNASTRRQQTTLNNKFDNNLAVISGDYLLSIALEQVIETNNIDVIKKCTSSLKNTCIGEINQYFNKYKTTSIEEYIQKSCDKTARLFEVEIFGGIKLADDLSSVKEIQKIGEKFARNFGIAFQIRDDLINLLSTQKSNETDYHSGIYTAPIIFAQQEDKNILKSSNIQESIKKTSAIEKTKDLMDNYFKDAIFALEDLENNKEKSLLVELIEAFTLI